MNYCGIDPGQSGAICLVHENGSLLATSPLPYSGSGRDSELDMISLQEILHSYTADWGDVKPFVVVEMVQILGAMSSKTSIGKSHRMFGRIEAVLHCGKFRHETVKPAAWQRQFWQKTRMPKGQKFDTKAAALKAARRLWPDQTWLRSPRCKNPDDGLVDAALMAEYGRRNRL